MSRSARGRIHLSALDEIDFVQRLARDGAFFFVDPPYGRRSDPILSATRPPAGDAEGNS